MGRATTTTATTTPATPAKRRKGTAARAPATPAKRPEGTGSRGPAKGKARKRDTAANKSGGGGEKKKSGQVVATIAAAAKAVCVHQRTLKEWLSRGCPGRAGHYDVAAIATWRQATIATSSIDEEAKDRNAWAIRELRAKALKQEIELLQLQGRLIEIEIPTRLYAQHIAEAKTLLEQLPDRFLSFVPSLSAATRRSVRQRVAAAVHDVLAALASALTSDATE